MGRFPVIRFTHSRRAWLFAVAFALFLTSCGGGQSSTANPATLPAMTSAPTSTFTAPAATVTPTAIGTPTSTSTPLTLAVSLLSPRDGLGVESDAVRVLGSTRLDAVVAINGTPVDVAADGSFQQDLVLDEGINSIEVVATDISGQTAFESVAVFSISPTAGLPFGLFTPLTGC